LIYSLQYSDDQESRVMTRTFNTKECAAFLKVHTNTVLDLAITGKLRGVKVGRAWVFMEDDVVAFLNGLIEEEIAKRRAAWTAPLPPDLYPEGEMVREQSRGRPRARIVND
jgi:excisionase family DNA binding protein